MSTDSNYPNAWKKALMHIINSSSVTINTVIFGNLHAEGSDLEKFVKSYMLLKPKGSNDPSYDAGIIFCANEMRKMLVTYGVVDCIRLDERFSPLTPLDEDPKWEPFIANEDSDEYGNPAYHKLTVNAKGLEVIIKLQEHDDNERRFNSQKESTEAQMEISESQKLVSEALKSNSDKSVTTARWAIGLTVIAIIFSGIRLYFLEQKITSNDTINDRISGLEKQYNTLENENIMLKDSIERINKPKVDSKPEGINKPKVESKPEGINKPKVESKPEGINKPKVESKPEGINKPKVESRPEGINKPKVESKPEGINKPKFESKPEGINKPKVESKPEGINKPKVESKPEGINKPKVESKPEGIPIAKSVEK
ncbi:hypothetical protein EKG38_03550 [Shewanella canadensis]|uniref:Uncharacterized protein n=1 Tax=Shewanella canadensis TaxID=271096 RepID=A0A431WZP3_9GAMM|nr:hypothetical protein [Shewanella canadensis]RTR40996.1 hypothetical protein EKG38_03550 [Shewanella canadensis]